MSSSPLDQCFCIADKVLRLEAPNTEIAAYLKSFLNGYAVSLQHRACSPDAIIKVVFEQLSALPLNAFEAVEISKESVFYTDRSNHFIVSANTQTRSSASRSKQVEICVSPALNLDNNGELGRALSIAIQLVLRKCGMFDLHAAALLNPRTRHSLLLVAGTGSGKSTLSILLASQKWNYLSDDSVFLSNEYQRVKAVSFRRDFALRTDSLENLPFSQELSNSGYFVPGTNLKKRFDWRELFPSQFAQSCFPEVIFFPQITGEFTSRTKKLAQAETMKFLLKMCPWACYDQFVAPQYLNVLMRLAQQCKSYQLSLGKDLLDAEFADQFFDFYTQ